MQKENKMTMVWFLIVILVVVGLVFITIYKKDKISDTTNVGQVDQNTNMQNTQQIEGVKVTILTEGTGDVVKAGDTAVMNYTGKLMDGTTFDSNIDPKFAHVQPFVFTIGAGQVIKGWDVGIAGMKVGEKRNLIIDPAFAYGEAGAGGVIPPNATLSFDVELISIEK